MSVVQKPLVLSDFRDPGRLIREHVGQPKKYEELAVLLDRRVAFRSDVCIETIGFTILFVISGRFLAGASGFRETIPPK